MSKYTRTLTEDDTVYDLVDVVEEDTKEAVSVGTLDDEIAGIVSRVTERVAREMFPAIAEKIIRDEIDKLKEKPGK